VKEADGLDAREVIVPLRKTRMLQKLCFFVMPVFGQRPTWPGWLRGRNKPSASPWSEYAQGQAGTFPSETLLGKKTCRLTRGRSVIVVGPGKLKAAPVGVWRKKMALGLFKAFIYHRLDTPGPVSARPSSSKGKWWNSQETGFWGDILERGN